MSLFLSFETPHEIRLFDITILRQQPPLLRVNGAWDDFSLIQPQPRPLLRRHALSPALQCTPLLLDTVDREKENMMLVFAEFISPERAVSYATLVLTEALTPRSAAGERIDIGQTTPRMNSWNSSFLQLRKEKMLPALCLTVLEGA